MKVVPLSKTEDDLQDKTSCEQDETVNWSGVAAGGALLAGGLLLLTGNRRAGTVAAVTGATLTLIDQQELVKTWWNQLPTYINKIEEMLGQAQGTIEQVQEMVDDLAAKREKVRTLLHY